MIGTAKYLTAMVTIGYHGNQSDMSIITLLS